MGAFFTNVQVHTGSLRAEEGRAMVIEALRDWATAQGARELTDEDRLLGRDAHRTILVGPVTGGPWVAVYDEITEDQRHDDMKALTQRMSEIAGYAVGVQDQHSDMLALWLPKQGVLIDEYRSQQERGHPELWRDVLVEGVTPEQLRGVLDAHPVFAEDLVFDLAPLLGWEAGLATTGFNYVGRDLQAGDLGPFTRLDFRSTTDPLAGRQGSGPPVLTQSTSFPVLQVGVDEPIASFVVMFQNTGGPSTGLTIVIWGPGLDLLDLDGVQLASQPGAEMREYELLHSVATEDSTPLRYVELTDFPIPRGITGSPYEPVPGLSMRRAQAAQYAACIALILTGRGAKPGTAELNIGVTPSENREEGQTSRTVQVIVN